MVLVLHRTYFPEGTQGTLEWNGNLICYTIELPWLQNQKRVSCVPEGEYILQQRFSKKFGWHLHLVNVPGRDLILIHPANDAKKELLGCIAPVTKHTGIGKGSFSRKALSVIKKLVYPVLASDEVVKLVITTKS
ncbi:DUF5675 family protein [Flavobacterium sp.]|uniref:DUF5675 family protein n=1 Tax=Flavobacterium sp. TaxID=239 RepID=UPI00286AEC18|nr:DUF5675 family protein [Flavobacterium sp.]